MNAAEPVTLVRSPMLTKRAEEEVEAVSVMGYSLGPPRNGRWQSAGLTEGSTSPLALRLVERLDPPPPLAAIPLPVPGRIYHAAITNGSSPASRVTGSSTGSACGGRPATALAIAAMCAGVEPQQPPRMLTWPASAHSFDQRRRGLGQLVVVAELVGQAGVGIDHDQRVGDLGQHLDVRAQLGRAERCN